MSLMNPVNEFKTTWEKIMPTYSWEPRKVPAPLTKQTNISLANWVFRLRFRFMRKWENNLFLILPDERNQLETLLRRCSLKRSLSELFAPARRRRCSARSPRSRRGDEAAPAAQPDRLEWRVVWTLHFRLSQNYCNQSRAFYRLVAGRVLHWNVIQTHFGRVSSWLLKHC